MSEISFSMFSRPESRSVQHGLGLTDGPRPPKALAEKYRPARFAEIVGQGAAVLHLSKFVETPYPTAFLFAGETGTGKTSMAHVTSQRTRRRYQLEPTPY